MEVKTRMAPSPTGNLHLGTAYATLWPYLFARKNDGTFILRIEDTDRERSTTEFEENIIEGLEWLGFDWDEGPFHQMERLDLYQKVTDQLLKEGKAYLCFCTKEELEEEKRLQIEQKKPQIYSGKCRNLTKEEVESKKKEGLAYVVRYKLPEGRGVVKFNDLIHGEIGYESSLIGDMVIMRQNGIPLYNFVVVIDDSDMGITHVLRGDDHISNTPKQILLFEALEKTPPKYGHYQVLLNSDRMGKLSKRTGSTSIEDFRKDGYLPDALINYLAILGWTPPEGKEILNLSEIIELFNLENMNKTGAAWNEAKLDWINGEYIRKMNDEELLNKILDYLNYISEGKLANTKYEDKEKIKKLIPLIRERIKKLSDFIPLTDFIFDNPEYDLAVFQKLKIDNLNEVLEKVLEKLESMEKSWDAKVFENTFRDLAEELNLSATQIFQLIRVAISGQTVSPPLFECMVILGEDESIARIKHALNFVTAESK